MPLVSMLVLYNTPLQAAYMGRGIATGASVMFFHTSVPAGPAVHGTEGLMVPAVAVAALLQSLWLSGPPA